jgi:hypothetical protein
LLGTIREFGRTRGNPRVEVHLVAGQILAIQTAVAGPGDASVTLEVYPDVAPGEEVLAHMVRRDPEGDFHTPRVVVVALHEIARVELLHWEPPPEGGQEDDPRAFAIGFQAPEEEG